MVLLSSLDKTARGHMNPMIQLSFGPSVPQPTQLNLLTPKSVALDFLDTELVVLSVWCLVCCYPNIIYISTSEDGRYES